MSGWTEYMYPNYEYDDEEYGEGMLLSEMTTEQKDMFFAEQCRCDGSGWYVSCMDDICHGLGHCMYDKLSCDGMKMCPNPECAE